VNVHPTKLEVRFQDSSRLYSQLLSTLRTKFLATDLTARVETPPDDDPARAHDDARAVQIRQQVVDWAKGKLASWGPAREAGPGIGGAAAPGVPNAPRPREPLDLTRLNRSWSSIAPEDADEEFVPFSIPDEPAAMAQPVATPLAAATRVRALQVHNRYLVAETEEGMLVIDQHALHERILYEQLRGRVMAGGIEAQSLLVPEPVDLSPAEAAAALEHRELLAQLGMRVEPFGGDTILVTGYPAMLANLNPVEVLQALLGQLLAGAKLPDRRDLLDELLHSIACKAAIKAGDRLSGEEIASLLEQRHLIDDPHHCPHGRPAALVFSREELDRQFKRV